VVDTGCSNFEADSSIERGHSTTGTPTTVPSPLLVRLSVGVTQEARRSRDVTWPEMARSSTKRCERPLATGRR